MRKAKILTSNTNHVTGMLRESQIPQNTYWLVPFF